MKIIDTASCRPEDEYVIEHIEDYFRTSALAQVTILPRWVVS